MAINGSARALLLVPLASAPALAQAAADLAVAGVNASPAAVTAGGNISLSATVSNLGNSASAASTLHFFSATDAGGGNNSQVCDIAVGPLAASETFTAPCAVAAPSAPGAYYFFACADPDAGETLTGNNCSATAPVNVAAAASACTTTSVTFSQTLGRSLASTGCLEALSDGSTYYCDVYEFSGTPEKELTITASSAQFDPFMYSGVPGQDYVEDDNSGGGTSARLVVTLPASGVFPVRVSSAFPFQSGAYSLSFSVPGDSAAPVSAATVTAIEYFHAGFGHYFITASPEEAAAIDSGKIQGWARTGQSFKAYPPDTPGASGVCRFFSAGFAPKSSHFYTPSTEECGIVKSNPNWQYEGLVFSVGASGAGACPAGMFPLYRLYNNGQGGAPNHRYSTGAGIVSAMAAQGWVSEGVVACVPD